MKIEASMGAPKEKENLSTGGEPPARRPRAVSPKIGVAIGALCLAAGCATSVSERDYTTRAYTSVDLQRPERETGDDSKTGDGSDAPRARSTTTRVPTIADLIERSSSGTDAAGAPSFSVGEIDAVVPPLALPMFVDLVFGEMLGVPYVTGPGVAARSDIVQLRSSGVMPSDTFLDLVQIALKDFGVRVSLDGGVYQIIEDSALKGRQPRFIRSRAKPDVPANLRPVVQFVELNAINARDMTIILQQAFGARNENLQLEPDTENNYIVLSGLPEDVASALDIIYEMDELRFAGTQVQRYTPAYWNSADLTSEIDNVLTAEGWQISTNPNSPRPILLMSVARSNDILVFTRSPEARARVRYWLGQLDRPAQTGDAPQLYVYDVQNLDAELLADTVNQVLYGSATGALGAQGAGGQAGAGQIGAGRQQGLRGQAGSGGLGGGLDAGNQGFIVDKLGNRLIFSGTASEYERLLPVLTRLDEAPAEVLIEVMIAQVTLTDSTSFGVDWTIQNLNDDNFTNAPIFSDERSGLEGIVSRGSLGPAGLAFGVFNPDVSVNIDAFAQNSQVNVLSTPRLVARSGASAAVQVGADVPIITSQRAAPNSTGADNVLDTLQTVQYRNTGIILNIEPIVFSDNRIDLNISQEVSAASAPPAGSIPSPTITSTSVTTLLSLQDGATAVIGGLIQDNVTRSEDGVPFLKDVPVIGNLFSSDGVLHRPDRARHPDHRLRVARPTGQGRVCRGVHARNRSHPERGQSDHADAAALVRCALSENTGK